jgi:hypothetical protein
MTNATLTTTHDLSLGETITLAELFAKSGFFADSREAAQCVTKIMAGNELGFGPVASMTGFTIIKGRVSMSANLMAAAVKRSGKYNYRVVKMDDTACEIAFFEGGQEIGRSLFTKADAQKAGTQNMDKFPRNMLFARAMSNGVKWYCPDITGGPVYTPEELGQPVNEDGEVIAVTAQVIEHVQTPTPARNPLAPQPVQNGNGKSFSERDNTSQPTADDWKKWYDLAEKASAYPTIVVSDLEPQPQATLGELRKAYLALSMAVKSAQQAVQ